MYLSEQAFKLKSFFTVMVLVFWSVTASAVPDDGFRGSGTKMTTVNTPAGPKSVVTTYNTNNTTTVKPANTTTVNNNSINKNNNTTSSQDDDDDSSSTQNTTSVKIKSDSPTVSSSLFTAVGNFSKSIYQASSAVYASVKKGVVSSANHFQEKLKPHVTAYMAGSSRAKAALGSGPTPAKGSPEYNQYVYNYQKAFFSGVRQAYLDQNMTPHNQLIPDGPLGLLARQNKIELHSSYYDPRLNENMYAKGSSTYSEIYNSTGYNPANPTNAGFEAAQRQVETMMILEIDKAFREGRVNVSMPGQAWTHIGGKYEELNPVQKFGLNNSVVIAAGSDFYNELMNKTDVLSKGNDNTRNMFSDGISLPVFNDMALGGFVAVKMYGDAGDLDTIAHELQHAGDTAILNHAYNLYSDPKLSKDKKDEIADVIKWAQIANGELMTGQGGMLGSEVKNKIQAIVGSSIGDDVYLDYITEYRAYKNQSVSTDGYKDMLVSELEMSPEKAQKIVDILESSSVLNKIDKTLNDYVEDIN